MAQRIQQVVTSNRVKVLKYSFNFAFLLYNAFLPNDHLIFPIKL